MRFTYQFANVDQNEILVSEEWADVLLLLDREERNTNRRETRRHISLDGMDYLCYNSWEKIAVKMAYSSSYVYKLHSNALVEMEQVLQRRPA